jgi:hypothetical protein
MTLTAAMEGNLSSRPVPRTVFVHVVLLKFAVSATAAQRTAFLEGLNGLLQGAPDALDYRFGLDAGVAPDADHYDFALTVAFRAAEDYIAYESSSKHDEFVRRCASPIVIGRATVQHLWPPIQPLDHEDGPTMAPDRRR